MSYFAEPQDKVYPYRVKQPLEELARKRTKAARKGFWTQEDVDYCHAWAKWVTSKLAVK